MGGVLILLSITASTLLWADLSNRFVWIVLLVTLGFGAIGWVDDWRKVVNKDPEGMRSARESTSGNPLIGLLAALYLVFSISESSKLPSCWSCSSELGQVGLFDLLTCRPKAGLLVPFLQGNQLSTGCVRLRDPHLPGDRRIKQCGEPDRRAGRPGHHAGRHGGFRLGRFRLCHGQARCFPDTSFFPTSRVLANS
jgi:hypothetical protein